MCTINQYIAQKVCVCMRAHEMHMHHAVHFNTFLLFLPFLISIIALSAIGNKHTKFHSDAFTDLFLSSAFSVFLHAIRFSVRCIHRCMPKTTCTHTHKTLKLITTCNKIRVIISMRLQTYIWYQKKTTTTNKCAKIFAQLDRANRDLDTC